MNSKVKSLNWLETFTASQKKLNKKIVLCHGDFDMLHLGHLKHFKAAKSKGDILIISVTSSNFIKKGTNRPYFNDIERLEFLDEISIVDYIYLDKTPNAIKVLSKIKPNFYVKGSDYKDFSKDLTKQIYNEEKLVKKNGGKLIFTDEKSFSSSSLIHNKTVSSELIQITKDIKSKFSFDLIIKTFDEMKKKKVLIIGDTILDEYVNVGPLGKPSKENIIATQYKSSELFLGGVFASIGNLSSFCDNIDIITKIGSNKKEEAFIKKNIPKNIKKAHLICDKVVTTKKTRFVMNSHSHLKKLFEIYDMNDNPINLKDENKIIKILKRDLKKYDMVIVNDYGHGLITPNIISVLEKNSKFLAVNAQINAGNQGYNLITKYKKADYYCIDLEEAKKAINIKNIDYKMVPNLISKKINGKYISITLGSNGSITKKKNGDCFQFPAFTNIIVDTMSAGDTYFVTSAMLIYLTKSIKLASFIGNLCGSMQVGLKGCVSINKDILYQNINSFFKIR